MDDLTKLRSDHAEIAKIARRLSEFIGRAEPPPQLELFDVRRQLSSTLIAHLKSEDWVLYPRLLASGDEIVASTARSFNEEMGGLAAAFARYNERWSATVISQDWSGYCADTRVIVDALMNRLTRENRELLPLLEDLDRAA